MLTLSALRLTNRGTGSPLAEPAAWPWADAWGWPREGVGLEATATATAKTITNRARWTCLMLTPDKLFEKRTPPGCFVLIRPSDTEAIWTERLAPTRTRGVPQCRSARLRRAERAQISGPD